MRARGLRLALGALLAAGLLSGPFSCGGATRIDPAVGGESHFLRRCLSECEGGLTCISGLCTQPCLVGQQGDAECSALAQSATCTAESIEPGNVAVCDVACAADSDCAELGPGHACENAYCRAEESATPAQPIAADCASYRNRSGNVPLTITVRNDRDTPVFIKPFVADCNDAPQMVRVTRDGREVHLSRSPCPASCEALQDGIDDSQICSEECVRTPLVRLDPAQEIEIGTFTSEFVSHGILPGTERMPAECVPSPSSGVLSCYSEAPLAAGRYELTVQALGECTSASCDCDTSVDGSCTTDEYVPIELEYEPLTDGLTASAVIDLSSDRVTLRFE